MLNFAAPKTDLAKSIAARAEGRTGGIKEMQEGRADLYKVNPYLIKVEDGFNVRDFESERMAIHVDELAQSIAAVGLKRALKVRMKAGTLVLVDGECRLRAIFRAIEVYGAEIRTIKVEMTDRAFSDADATLSIAVENDALELTPLEKGTVFKRLENYGWAIADIAKSVGLSSVRVTQLIELTSVPEAVKVLIRQGNIAPTLALTIAKDENFDETAIMARVGEAQTTAASKGKTRVTAKNVAGTRTSLREEVAKIIQSATICEDEEDGEETVMIALSSENAALLGKLLKIIVAAPVAQD
jgi:ParB/RepB/Spo0J family partition protein